MKRYWLSWYQPTEDYRPVTCPPNDAVLGYWCSGQRVSDDAWTMCSLVRAADEDAAKQAVVKDWPEATEWRFVEEKPLDYALGDRFPVTRDWEKERMKK